MTAVITMEEYQTLTRRQKVIKVLPKVLPLIVLSIILPTADIGTDIVLIKDLYEGLNFCVKTDEMGQDQSEYWKCQYIGPNKYCNSNSSRGESTQRSQP